MNHTLKQMAVTLLRRADEAVDRRDNGLWDREDFIHLIDQLRQLTRNFVDEQKQLECDQGELTRRLQRSMFQPRPAGAMKKSAVASD